MRERVIRVSWPALVAGAFCIPLFIGLGNLDLRGDEAGHSFSVDLILETGEWLLPKASPVPDYVFLEKPPLKFWIVAAGIEAGLPHDEFGLRFWDALFGGLAFLYVFGIGRRLDGPICGTIAVLILFVNRNLLFEHGLRDNAMEAPLLLAYCGGIFHYMKWFDASGVRARRLHPIAVGLHFALGFMVKFVAALFLPMILGAIALTVGSHRRRLLEDWRSWLLACGVALGVSAPWFVYVTYVFGAEFWNAIFGSQVYTRLTAYLDPNHLNPWYHYLRETYRWIHRTQAVWLVAPGALLLIVDTVRRRRADGLLVLVWFAMPVTLISFGTSKLYHYAYPFLPPVALAGGYFTSRAWAILRPRVDRIMSSAPGWRWTAIQHPATRTVLTVLGAAAAAVLLWTFVVGPIDYRIGGVEVKNSRLLRPGLIAALLLTLAGRFQLAGRIGLAFLVLLVLPIRAYWTTMDALDRGTHVFGPARDCILRVSSGPELRAAGPRGIYVDGDGVDYESPFNHEFSYYFRRINPWIRRRATPPARLYEFVADPAEQRPLLLSGARYHAVSPDLAAAAGRPVSLPRLVLHDNVLLVLPGPYAVCEAEQIELAQRQQMTRGQ